MNDPQRPFVYILQNIGDRVVLDVHYAQKVAEIRLPAGTSDEAATAVYRRELEDLLAALQDISTTRDSIQWPPSQTTPLSS